MVFDISKEFRNVHRDRRRNIGKNVNGKWVWGQWHKLQPHGTFTASSSTQNQQSNSAPTSTNNTNNTNNPIISEEPPTEITTELITEADNVITPQQDQSNNQLDLSTSIMGEKHLKKNGFRSTASGSSPSITGTPRSNPRPSLLDTTETLVAPPTFLDSVAPSASPATPSSHARASRQINSPNVFTTINASPTERRGDSSSMYAPKSSSERGGTFKKPDLAIDFKSIGLQSSGLVTDKIDEEAKKVYDANKAEEARLAQNLRYSEWNMGPEIPAEDIQPRTKEAQRHLKGRLDKGQLCINTNFPAEEPAPGAIAQEDSDRFKPSLVERTTSSNQVPISATMPDSSITKPDLRLPQKPKSPALKPNDKLPEKTRRQAFEPMKIDTVPEDTQEKDASVAHFDTPPAIKAYRERYLPSIQSGSPPTNKSKMAVASPSILSTANIGAVVSTVLSKRPVATQVSAPPPAEPMALANHPAVSGMGDDGLFQTPGAVPYNLTPSPADSSQEDDSYESYGGRSPSPLDNDLARANSPPMSINAAASVPIDEAARVSVTKAASVNRAASPKPRSHNTNVRDPADTDIQNTGDMAHSPIDVKEEFSPPFKTQNLNTHNRAVKNMQRIIDLTESDDDAQNPIEHSPVSANHAISPSARAQRPGSNMKAPALNVSQARPSMGSENRQHNLLYAPDSRPQMGSIKERPSSLSNPPEHTSEPQDLEQYVQDTETILATRAAFEANLAEKDRVAAPHLSQYRDGRAPSPEPFGSIVNKKVSAITLRGSEQIDNPVKNEIVDRPNQFKGAAASSQNRAVDDTLQGNTGHDQRNSVPSRLSADNVVESTEIDASFEGDSMEIDQSAELEPKDKSRERLEISSPYFRNPETQVSDERMDMAAQAPANKLFKAAASIEDDAMDIDERLDSDLSDVPSDTDLEPIKDITERLMSEEEVKQALIDRVTGPVFPKTIPSNVIDADAYELAKEGEYFPFASAFFKVIPKKVLDEIWKDKYDRPKLTLFEGNQRWIRPLDPTIKQPVKPDPSSSQLIKVTCEVEKLLLTIWVAVESIVVVLSADIDREFTRQDLSENFRRYQMQVFNEWKNLYAHLLTLTDWKERYFAISNIEKRGSRQNADPYARLFTIKNPTGHVFYGTGKYLRAMKYAIAAAQYANECAMMKGPRWQILKGMSWRALAEEFGNCLDGLRLFNTVTRKRDWDVPGEPWDEAPPSMGDLDLSAPPGEDKIFIASTALERFEAKKAAAAAKEAAKEKSDSLGDVNPPKHYEAPSKPKGKGIAVKSEIEEQSDGVSDGDPPDYEDSDDEEDEDYTETRSHQRRRGLRFSIQPPNPRKKRSMASNTSSTSRRVSSRVSSREEMKFNNRGKGSSMTHSTLGRPSSDDDMKVGSGGRSTNNSQSTEFTELPPRTRAPNRPGAVPKLGSFKGAQKGAKRQMVEVDTQSSSPQNPKEYFETP